MSLNTKADLYRRVAKRFDMAFARVHEDWFKLSGHRASLDVRIDPRTEEELITLTASGKAKFGEQILIALDALRKAKRVDPDENS